MISFRSISLAMAILATTAVSAFAEKRVALVIGNSAYKNVAQLQNPANDAAVVAEMFKSAGLDTGEFPVEPTRTRMCQNLREVGHKRRDAAGIAGQYCRHRTLVC